MGSIGETHSNGQAHGDDHGYPRKPLQQSGLLNERFESDDLTPVIGREFPEANIVDDLMNSPDADTLLRDLAVTSTIANYIHMCVNKLTECQSANAVLSSSVLRQI
jgi:hypothetical protein